MSGWESSLVKATDFGDRWGMSLDLITEEMIARQPAEAQAIIRVLLAKLAELEAEVRALKKTQQDGDTEMPVFADVFDSRSRFAE